MDRTLVSKGRSRLAHVLRLALLLATLAWMSAPARTTSAAVTILYVKSDAAGLNNGTSWANAYISLQSALDAAVGGVYEIWVAAGTYRPFHSLFPVASETFQLHNNVALYGGFAGTETQRDQRNWVTNVATLNGYWFTFGNPHTAYHVVTANGTNGSAVLDGFTVAGGKANGTGNDANGGGMLNINAAPIVTNVIFIGNSANERGGGMYNDTSNPALTNITFTGNSAHDGGGLLNMEASPTLAHVTFSANSATNGGGIFNTYSSSTLTDVIFNGNSAGNGGGIYNAFSSPTFYNLTFSGNSATYEGGGMRNQDASSPTLMNITFTGNTAANGGGISDYHSGHPTLVNITFNGNSATNRGGGMFSDTSIPTLTNVIFSGNSAGEGGGMYFGLSCVATLTNVTFAGNSATNHGGAIANMSSHNPGIVNSILWGNIATFAGLQIYDFPGSTSNITFSDIQGGYSGTGNMNADPKFVRNSAPALSDYGDLHLGIGSPAIDVGSNAAIPSGVTTDRDGHPRIMGTKVDMGAYEAFLKLFLPLTLK